MVLTAAKLVCTNRDGMTELSHVWGSMNQYLDYSSGWTLERAAAQGMKFLVQHLALTSPKTPQEENNSLVMDFAACNGHLDILTWLHNTEQLSGCSTRAMDDAAKNGHLPIVQWLHVNRSEGCTTKAMDYAASSGHLSVVQWLHTNRSEGCTTRAMDLAAQNGQLQVLQWLSKNRSEGCTPSAVNYAATEGHLHIVRWLCEIRKEECTSSAMVNAARGGHLYILEYLGDRFPQLFESVGPKMVHAAIANGQAAILTWLIAVLPVKSLKCEEAAGSWMDVASEYGQVGILKWFHDHATALPMSVDGHLPACTVEAIEKAARNGHKNVLVFLHENDLVNLSVESDAMNALVAAVEGGHRNCVEWLIAHFRDLYRQSSPESTVALDAAAAVGHVDILQFLRVEPTTCKWQSSSKAVDEAARQGFVDVLRWLHFDRSNHIEEEQPNEISDDEHATQTDSRWTPMALELAATNGHLSVVQWLTEHHREVCSNFEAFNAASYMDHLEVAQFLYSDVRGSCSVEQALEHAEEGGAEDTLAWLEGLN
ncbi:putative ankyrin repeat protein [Phytophthora citrophthora]|uniref:Ankyrin repeat protein n=1 Tax=Phytophthora citrophthora TaxID=4793 RepID=A0AAD9FZU6_9STRA|nr:putative ankyrin repeat protein [Phytophthora citrophthora]